MTAPMPATTSARTKCFSRKLGPGRIRLSLPVRTTRLKTIPAIPRKSRTRPAQNAFHDGAPRSGDAGHERQDLGGSNQDCRAERELLESGAAGIESRRPAPQPLAREHDCAVHDQEGRGEFRAGKEILDLALEEN